MKTFNYESNCSHLLDVKLKMARFLREHGLDIHWLLLDLLLELWSTASHNTSSPYMSWNLVCQVTQFLMALGRKYVFNNVLRGFDLIMCFGE